MDVTSVAGHCESVAPAAGWLETACSVESIGVLSETDVMNQT